MNKEDWATIATTRLGLPALEVKPPKSVHLVGLGPTHILFQRELLRGDAPNYIANADAVWTINRGVWFVPHDLCFVMDNIQGEADQYPVYGSRLWHHNRPIITSDNCAGWPAHVRKYPLAEITEWVMDRPNPPDISWITNSLPFVLLFAAWIGVENLHLWGIDYHNHNSSKCEEGKANASYWARFAEECGVQLHIPEDSTFMDMSTRKFFYGYHNDPRKSYAERRRLFRNAVGLDLEDS